MSEMTPVGSSELAIPQGTALATAFRTENGFDPVIEMIEREARSHVPDTSTKKGREAIASLAYKVSRSKTTLDEAGKSLNDAARAEINIVDAARRKVRERLDALRDEVRKPLVDWEAAEELRINGLKSRLRALDASRADANSTAAQIAEVLAEVEGIGLGEDWKEYQSMAALAKDKALTELRRNLQIAQKREDDAAELERLRAAQAKRDEEGRIRREAEEAAARLADRAKNARAYIEQIGKGMIGGQAQAHAVLIYELETKLPPLVAELGDHAASVEQLRRDTLAVVVFAAEAQRKEDEAYAEEQRKAAAERAATEAQEAAERQRIEDAQRHERELAEAKRREEEAEQRERDRLAAERKAEADARAKREADRAHRQRIRDDIATSMNGFVGEIEAGLIADAIMDGAIPHVFARL